MAFIKFSRVAFNRLTDVCPSITVAAIACELPVFLAGHIAYYALCHVNICHSSFPCIVLELAAACV